MSITEIGLKNQRLVLGIYVALVLFGLYSMVLLPKEKLPNIPVGRFNVTVQDDGLSSASIHHLISKPIVNAVQSLPHRISTISTSYSGYANVTLIFETGSNIQEAYNGIKKKVNQISSSFPSSASKPTITQLTVNDIPLVWLSVESHVKTPLQLTHYVEKKLKPGLEQLKGVNSLLMVGAVPKKIRVHLDPVAMSKSGINLDMIYHAFQVQNTIVPGGSVEAYTKQYFLILDFNLKSIKEIENMIITYRKGVPIRLSTVAKVSLQDQPEALRAYHDGKPVILIGVQKTGEANTLTVLSEVKRFLEENINPLKDGVKITSSLSKGPAIKDNLYALATALLYSVLFSGVVVYLFLGSFRLSLIVLSIIPVPLCASLIALSFWGLSLNTLSLLCLVLLIGIGIDDIVIIVENFVAGLDSTKLTNIKAYVISAAEKVSSSIIVYAICMSIIFLSVAFTQGVTRVLFFSVSVVLVTGVIVSAIMSVMLASIRCANSIKNTPVKNRLCLIFDSGLGWVKSIYLKSLKGAIKFPKIILLISVLSIVPIKFVMKHMDKNLFPSGSTKTEINVTVKADNTMSRQLFNEKLLRLTKLIRQNDNIQSTLTTTSRQANHAKVRCSLVPYSKRKVKNSQRLLEQIQNAISPIVGLDTNVSYIGIIVPNAQPLKFVIYGPKQSTLLRLANQLPEVFDKQPKLGRMLTFNSLKEPNYTLHINREMAAQMGLNPKEIAQAVALYGGGIKVGRTLYKSKTDYDIYLYAKASTLIRPSDLHKIYIYNSKGEAINLDSVASIKIESAARSIMTYNGHLSLIYESTPSVSLSKAAHILKTSLKPVLPKGATLVLLGQERQLKSALNSLAIAIILAIILIYFVLSSQFDSFYLPTIFLIAQPLAITMVVYILFLSGIGLNIFSLMGVFLLIGLKTKNFILIINYMNKFRASGENLENAAYKACEARFRPISMTSLIIILGMLPPILISGPTQVDSISLGVPIIGGVFAATFYSLYFLPACYVLFLRWSDLLTRKFSH